MTHFRLVALFLFCLVPIAAGAATYEEYVRTKRPRHWRVEREFVRATAARPPRDFEPSQSRVFCRPSELISRRVAGAFYDVYRHESLPIIHLNFATEEAQDLMLDRMVTFAAYDNRRFNSKTIRSPDYADTAGMNIRGRDVAAFYNLMNTRKLSLNALENRLLENLLNANMLQLSPQTEKLNRNARRRLSVTSEFALMSAAVGSPVSTCEHEFRHSLYAVKAEYQQGMDDVYRRLSAKQKRFVARVLYKIGDHTLAKGFDNFVTELAAYFLDSEALFDEYHEVFPFGKKDKAMVREIAERLEPVESEALSSLSCAQAR